MADTLSANVAEITQEIITATQMQLPQMAPAMNLITKVEIPAGKNSAEIPRANSTFSVDTPADGDEIVNTQQFDLTSTTISPTLRSQLVRVSYRARHFSQEDLLALISQEAARSQGQDIDTDITAEFANFHTDNDVGTTNTDLVFSVLRTARRLLQDVTVANGGPPPQGSINTLLAPIAVENLITNLGAQAPVATGTATGQQFVSQGLSEEFIRNYFVPGINLVGVPVFWDGYITEDGSADDICAMFASDSIHLAMSKDWSTEQFNESNWLGTILRWFADYNTALGKYTHWGAQITADGA